MIGCPACPRTWSTEQTLTAHLIDAHEMEAAQAAVRARVVFKEAAKMDRRVEKRAHRPTTESPPAEEEPPMPRERKTTGPCGYCKRERPDHRARCPLDPRAGAKKRKAITRSHPMKPRKAAGSKRARVEVRFVSELEALRTTAVALEPLGPVERIHVLACVVKLFAIDTSELAA